MSIPIRIATVAIVIGATNSAAAQDLGVSVGVVEALSAPPDVRHSALYVNAGGTIAIALDGAFLIPGFAIEVSPDTGAWGIVASVVLDVPITDAIGFDVNITALTDQVGSDFTHAVAYVGGGVGTTLTLSENWSVSPAVNAYAGLFGASAAWTPLLLVGYTFR